MGVSFVINRVQSEIQNHIIRNFINSDSIFNFMSLLIFRPTDLDDTTNELEYNVSDKGSFGTISCRGKNEIGEQKTACLFQLLPKGTYKNFFFAKFPTLFICSFLLQNLRTNEYLNNNAHSFLRHGYYVKANKYWQGKCRAYYPY